MSGGLTAFCADLLRLLPAGAVARWGLHPLESAAFARRTPLSDAATSWPLFRDGAKSGDREGLLVFGRSRATKKQENDSSRRQRDACQSITQNFKCAEIALNESRPSDFRYQGRGMREVAGDGRWATSGNSSYVAGESDAMSPMQAAVMTASATPSRATLVELKMPEAIPARSLGTTVTERPSMTPTADRLPSRSPASAGPPKGSPASAGGPR